MNTEKLFKLVMMDLTSDIIKLEQMLEDSINNPLGKDSINERISQIKNLLQRLTEAEAKLVKFTSMITPNNEEKLKDNGTN